MADKIARTFLAKYDEAKGRRANWEWHWQECADFVLPTREFTQIKTPGGRRRDLIFNDAAPLAAESLAAAMHGLFTNPMIRWFALGLADFEFMDEEAELWLYDATSRMLQWFNNPASKFALSSHEIYLDLAVFGSAICLKKRTPRRLTFEARALNTMYIVENDDQEVVATHRRIQMPAWEAVQKFSRDKDRLCDAVKKQGSEPGTWDSEIEFVHVVWQRNMMNAIDAMKVPGIRKPWGSMYIDVQRAEVVREGGFDSNPYLTPRWAKAAEETYGRSPAMSVLPGIKVVNAMERTTLIAGEQAVRPPLNAPAGAMKGPIRTIPGWINYYRQGSRDRVEPMQLGTRPDMGEALIRDHETKIEKAFFLDLLELPGADKGRGHPRMTAEEIIQRRQQGLIKASPILARLYAEWLVPSVAEVFDWMLRGGLFLPLPPSMLDKQLIPKFQSPMALSQRASESQNVTQAIQVAAPFIETAPEAIDNFDPDVAVRGIWDMFGADPRFLRSQDAVAQVRQQRAAALAQQQQMEQAAAGSQAIKDAGSGVKALTDANVI